MKSRILLGLLVSMLATIAFIVLAQKTHTESTFTEEPVVSLKEALSLAEQHVAKEKIDVSRHFLESIRLVYITGKRQWIVTWTLKTPSDGGQVFIHVKMDKSVAMTEGL